MTDGLRVAGIRDAVARRDVSALQVCEAALERIAARNPELNAFLRVDGERARARAAALDRRADLASLPLAGVPVALKDNICTKDLETTAGSRILEGYRPPYDAAVVERLEAAGAVIVGKTNCDEFAMGSSTENSAFGPTRNPWDLNRTPGGSSGGSAAAVAAGLVPLALGSDTGGSIRQPASFCGITGFKPTYGRVSRYGLLAFASSLDQIGPLTIDVAGAALAWQAIAGHDPRDSTSLVTGDSTSLVTGDSTSLVTNGTTSRPAGDLSALRIGVPRALLDESAMEGEVRAAFERAVSALAAAGARVVDVTLPHAPLTVAVYYVLATAEAGANLARYDGVRYGRRVPGGASVDEMYARTRGEGFGREVKRRLLLGAHVLSAGYRDAYYRKAQQVRTLVARDYMQAFGRVDVVACPTSPTAAFPLGERTADPLRMYLSDVFTTGPSLAGLPAISVPCGRTAAGLPVGFQFVGAPLDDARVLAAGAALEALGLFA